MLYWILAPILVLSVVASLWIVIQWILSDARDKERFRDPNKRSPGSGP